MDEIVQFFTRRPLAQRAFLAFTVAMFLACAAQIAAHAQECAAAYAGRNTASTPPSNMSMTDAAVRLPHSNWNHA